MKPIRLLKSLCWALLLSLSLGAYLFLANDAVLESAEAVDTETVDSRYHVLGDVLLLKKAFERSSRLVPR